MEIAKREIAERAEQMAEVSREILMNMRKPRILIVDDNHANVELLKMQLRGNDYLLDFAYNGEEALEKVKTFKPDLMLLDLMMPKMDGYEVCRLLKSDKSTWFIPIVIVTALRELQDKIKAIETGADEFLIKPYNKLELTTRVKSLLRMKEMHDDLDNSEDILFSLVKAIESRDRYTSGHSERVARHAVELAKALNLSEGERETIHKGALLHDIGKIGTRESVLLKPGPLTDEEMDHVRQHTKIGYEICHRLKSLSPTLTIIRNHHERFDGKGYPDGLSGEDISLHARIVAVIDSYDAMISERPYRGVTSPKKALEIFKSERDSGQWDPKLVDLFVKIMQNQTT